MILFNIHDFLIILQLFINNYCTAKKSKRNSIENHISRTNMQTSYKFYHLLFFCTYRYCSLEIAEATAVTDFLTTITIRLRFFFKLVLYCKHKNKKKTNICRNDNLQNKRLSFSFLTAVYLC